MLDRKTLQALGCWDGYKLDRVVWPEGEGRTLALYLKPVRSCVTRIRGSSERGLLAGSHKTLKVPSQARDAPLPKNS